MSGDAKSGKNKMSKVTKHPDHMELRDKRRVEPSNTDDNLSEIGGEPLIKMTTQKLGRLPNV